MRADLGPGLRIEGKTFEAAAALGGVPVVIGRTSIHAAGADGSANPTALFRNEYAFRNTASRIRFGNLGYIFTQGA